MTEAESLEQDSEAALGRAVVRDILINRLKDAGLRRPRGLTEEAMGKSHDRLCEHLAYMRREVLEVLSKTVLIEATKPGPAAGFWPAEVTIRSWAEALQPRPFALHPIVTSWLRSIEGPMAEAGGYLVELLRWLRKHRRPPLAGDMATIKRQAAEAQAQLARVRERIGKNVPHVDDHDILQAWLRDLEEAQGYVDAGKAHRAMKAAAE